MKQEHETQPPIPLRKRLSGKLIWAFALMSFFGSAVHLVTFLTLHRFYTDRALQIAYWEIAEQYAARLSPLTSPVFRKEEIDKEAFFFQRVNETFDVHLLDGKGKLLFSTATEVCEYPVVESIQAFLESDGYPFRPIYGPRLSDCYRKPRQVPFSAAKITIEGKPAFVYVVLQGTLHRELYNALGDVSLPLASIIFFLLLSVITAVLGVLLLFFFTKRFQKLTHAVGKFSAGDYQVRIYDQTDDELGLHAQAFNQMAQTIQDNIAKLEESDSLRRQLVANVSHDLRTPVQAMSLLLETLHDELKIDDNSDHLEFVNRAILNCQELRTLIDDLFELSRLDAKEEKLELETIDIVKVLRDIVNKFLISAEEKDMAIRLDCPPEFPGVLAEERLLIRAVSNLVENAIRYSRHGGELCISAEQVSDSEVELSVSDDGEGIPPEDLPHLFDRFFRGTRAAEREKTGSGLGLAIVKRIVELHGSTISVESTMGKGSKFSFRLSSVS